MLKNLIYPLILFRKFILSVFVSIKKNELTLIEGTALAKLCDYSFGDQASILCNIYGGRMSDANAANIEFEQKIKEISAKKKVVTLFIDNLRLYNREIKANPEVLSWITQLQSKNDLLKLCASFPNFNFIIFTNLEDTPIDLTIEGKIPSNVLTIRAVNAIYNNEKVIPFPYGIQRRMWKGDIRQELLLFKMNKISPASKLLYVNHSLHTNLEARSGIKEFFYDKPWATVINQPVKYSTFLDDIRKHKFIICPEGNAIDCHRNWEVLYMRRVPVMKNDIYLKKLYRNLPVLFVDEFSDVNEELLIQNNHIYQQALTFDMKQLDLNHLYNQIVAMYS